MNGMWSGRRLIALAGVVATASAAAGCGGSLSSASTSASSSASASSTTSAAAAVAVEGTVRGVASPAGARSLSKAGLAALGHVARGAGVSGNITGFAGLPIQKAIPAIAGDINTFWSRIAANSKVAWPGLREVMIFSGSVKTACSGMPKVSATDRIFICAAPPNGSQPTVMYWPVPFIEQHIDLDPGRVFLSFTMAMVWGYQVQNVVGAVQALQQGAITKGQFAQENVCLTAVYVNSINNRRMFQQGDSPAIQTFFNKLTGTFGITSPDVTVKQLQAAFLTGFKTGSPGACQQLAPGASGGGGGSTTPSSTSTTT